MLKIKASQEVPPVSKFNRWTQNAFVFLLAKLTSLNKTTHSLDASNKKYLHFTLFSLL